MKKVTIHTDGSCLGNPGPGGWAAILEYCPKGGTPFVKKISGGEAGTTNNRMELTAAIMALSALKEKCQIDLSTDSTYLKNGITKWIPGWIAKNWKLSDGKAVKNRDLWEKLAELTSYHDVTWHWEKGHHGLEKNEECDRMARSEAEKLKGKKY